MKLTRITTWVTCVFAGMIVSGCGEVVKLYPGPELPRDQVTTLKCWGHVHLVIDGKTVSGKKGDYWTVSPVIQMLPGSHTIKWRITRAYWNFTISGSGVLDAKPEHGYHLKSRVRTGGAAPPDYHRLRVIDSASWIEDNAKVVHVGEKPDWVKDGLLY